jgi:hypothetical protein
MPSIYAIAGAPKSEHTVNAPQGHCYALNVMLLMLQRGVWSHRVRNLIKFFIFTIFSRAFASIEIA